MGRTACLPIAGLVLAAACLPSYTLVADGSGGQPSSSSTSTSTSSSSTGSGGSGGSACTSPSCDPKNCGPQALNCLGGACVNGACQPEILVEEWIGPGVAADGARIYWSSITHSAVSSCPLAGCGAEQADRVDIAPGQLGNGPIVLTPTHAYFSINGTQGAARRCELDTWAIETLIEPIDSSDIVVHGGRAYVAMANSSAGKVLSCPLTGCGADTLTYAAIGNAPVIKVAVTDSFVFWSVYDWSIQRCPIAGCAPSPELVVKDATYFLAVSNGWLFFALEAYAGGGVFKCPEAGCGANDADRVLLAETLGETSSLIVDGSYVYWTESGSAVEPTGRVMRASVDGGDVTVIADNQPFPYAVAVRGGAVYWVNGGVSAKPGEDSGLKRVVLWPPGPQ